MQVLVTGGAGFIGSHLCEHLIAEGHHVYCLDNLSNSDFSHIQNLTASDRFIFVKGDCENEELLDDLIPKVDGIFHLAAVLGVKHTVEHPLHVINGNLEGTSLLLKKAFRHHKKVVFASTSEVYGKNTATPFSEDESDRILGATSVHRWCYSSVKALEEHLCLAYGKEGLPVTILRYFNAFGPRATSTSYGGVVPIFIKAALKGEPLEVFGDGKQSRCFTFVKDTAAATARAMSPKADGLVINIGTEAEITIASLAERIKKLTASPSKISTVSYQHAYGPGYEDMLVRKPDITRMKEVLGYEPVVRLEQGLLETIDWYRAHLP
ncbi:SDR family NAD(P)-dependent oxidoreductase [Halalkalibacter oceani]|uniref:SDR family NAD(P)-dependent oxidoreductase n=1 Tax=Halalkalibacter oceani TaxID=1653776 RepID=A0A9X2DSV8_9BACI|nr:SDR family NAD(P)-dependent oxidoreductase [Halalkalibacter oceani]